MNLLNSLKAIPSEKQMYAREIRFAGYADMLSKAENMLKLCTLALSLEETEAPGLMRHKRIDIASVMEVALQLWIGDEKEYLDEMLHAMAAPERECDVVSYRVLAPSANLNYLNICI